MKLVIKGNTPAQKNQKRSFVHKQSGKIVVMNAPLVQKWKESAMKQLINYPSVSSLDPTKPVSVGLSVTFYRDSARKYDLDNAYSTVADALVAAKILPSDDNTVITTVQLSDGGIDRENPRAEIYIDQ